MAMVIPMMVNVHHTDAGFRVNSTTRTRSAARTATYPIVVFVMTSMLTVHCKYSKEPDIPPLKSLCGKKKSNLLTLCDRTVIQ